MKMMTIKMIMLTNTIIKMMCNTLSMGTTLLILTILMTMLMNKMSSSSWYSMMKSLMLSGELLFLFTYMSSMVAKEKSTKRKPN